VPDPSLEQPSTEAGLERLHDAVSQLSELVRDAVRKSVALETRIEALPGPHDIAVAVEAELERTVRDARDAIDARVGQLSGDLDSLEHRLTEIGDALIPLEGLRTEIATVADQSASFSEIRAAISDAVGRIGSVAPPPSSLSPAPAVDTDELTAAVRGALDSTVASIRADFEVLVRAEQEEAEKRIDALGLRITNLSMSVSKALDDLVGHSARIDERASLMEGENAAILEAVRKEVASAVTVAGEEVRVRTEALGDSLSARAASIETSMADRVSSFEGMLAERVASLQANLVEQMKTLNAQVGALPADMVKTLAEINSTLSAVGDLSGIQAKIESAAEQTRSVKKATAQQSEALERLRTDHAGALAQLADRMAEVAPTVAAALADVREALGSSRRRASDELEGDRAAFARALADMKEALRTTSRRTSGEIAQIREQVGSSTRRTGDLLEGLRSPLKQMADASGDIARARAEMLAAVAALDEHLVQRTAGVKTSITEKAARLENEIAALPGPDDVATAVVKQLGPSMTDAQRKAGERADGLRQDMTGVATNVNEIWVRVRALAQGLEEMKAASKEDAGTLVALIEEMAQSEERSAARLAVAERRFVAAVQQIEHERDRVFIETMNEFLERLPRRERKRLSKRMRALTFSRQSKEDAPPRPEAPPAPLEPAAPMSVAEPEVVVELPTQQPKKPRPPKKAQARAREAKKPARKQATKEQEAAPVRGAAKAPSKPRAARAKQPAKASRSPEPSTTPASAPEPANEPDRPV